ncbi:MFS transporter [Sulfobacillus harzensis]|uniref:MFS transporter n=1 Tax=Sulfobacillus harzensis TaxID=2729629 RepID=A0A7Y0Q482_9FIRM|nr:MFS transporter [Sulfobacillus harzensis]NMP24155.1 MFS transporter [Sulfobacillus harzensis]
MTNPGESENARWVKRNAWLLLGGQWVSQMGNVCFTVAVYWLVLADTHSRADLGLVGAATSISGLFSVVSGVLVDSWDRRRTMIATDLVRFGLLAGAAWLLRSPHSPLIFILSLVAAVNLLGSLFSPAQYALLPDIVPLESLETINGLDQSATALSQWVGYGIGGLAMAALGAAGLASIDAATFLVSALTLFGIRTLRNPAPATSVTSHLPDVGRAIVAGQRTLWTHPFLKRALPTALVVNLAMMALTVLDAAWARQQLHGHASLYGLLEGATVLGAIVGGLVATRLPARWPLTGQIMGALALAGLAMMGMAIYPAAWASLGALGLIGAAFGILNAVMTTTIQQAVPGEVLGRIGGSLMAVSAVSTPVGAILAGWAGSILPLPLVYGLAGALVVVMAFPFLTVPPQFAVIHAQDEPSA